MTRTRDERFMKAALSMGRRGLGTTSPNPSVGCVLVRGAGADRIVVGRGWTAPGGRPHAETEAIRAAGDGARGATAYVTLEPCAHHGRTPPCAQALIGAGIRRVVTALEDPDNRVAGLGHRMLEDAGIEVLTGVLAGEARHDLGGYLCRVTAGRPHVMLKLAVSDDDRIAAGPNQTTSITGELARRRGHLMRARHDAIVVGINTARVDDPLLTCRLAGLEGRSPVRVVIDARLDLGPGSRLAETAQDTPVWLLAGGDADDDRAAALKAAGIEILPTRLTNDGKVDLAEGLRILAGRGINTVMVEGGARIAAALLKADLVDEVALFRAPVTVGADGLDALADMPMNWITESQRFRLTSELPLGPDRLIAYERDRTSTSDP